jgi:hypothetical protein
METVMKRFRESRLGRFVTRAQAAADPAGTVAETVNNDHEVVDRLRTRCGQLEATMLDLAQRMQHTHPWYAQRLTEQAHNTIPEERA